MKVITTEKIPIKMWLEDIEENAMKQVVNLANLPFAFDHIAIMPDSHFGFGMPIGGVLATKDVIIPNAVGVDIGCGMCALKTNIKIEDFTLERLKQIMGEIRKQIPVGFNHHSVEQDIKYMPNQQQYYPLSVNDSIMPVVCREFKKALTQVGTLGGGNHFIELQKGNDGFIWVMIHSGSRNIGKQVADYYNDMAKKLNEKWFSVVPKEYDLAFLPVDSEEGQMYIAEMQYCVEFALANRKLMMERIIDIIGKEFCPNEMINIAHNYARLEHHLGRDVWVHRKGATLADVDTIGIIPGSQGTKSYIVKGKGNIHSFKSCSHGAGRAMGRNEAMKRLVLADEIKKLNDQGIVHGIRSIKDLDEAAGAYKNIDVVMKNQEDLVEIITELTPLGVIKG